MWLSILNVVFLMQYSLLRDKARKLEKKVGCEVEVLKAFAIQGIVYNYDSKCCIETILVLNNAVNSINALGLVSM